MAFTNSFHSSAKSHSIGSSAGLSKVERHNARGYYSFEYASDKIHALVGTPTNIFADVRRFIDDTFSDFIEEYNERQRRADRKIEGMAFEYFCNNKKLDIAAEAVFQVGDKDYWARWRSEKIHRRGLKEYVLKSFPPEVQQVMDDIFRRQMEAYEHIYDTHSDAILSKVETHYANAKSVLAEFDEDPAARGRFLSIAEHKSTSARDALIDALSEEERKEYARFAEAYFAVQTIEKHRYRERIREGQLHIKVLNGTAHYDEWSPHTHCVSVCWADGYQSGLSSRVAKSIVLNRYALEVIQDRLHEIAAEEIARHPEIFENRALDAKQKGRALNYSTEEFIRRKQQALLRETSELSLIRSRLQGEKGLLELQNDELRDEAMHLSGALQTVEEYREQVAENDQAIEAISDTIQGAKQVAAEHRMPPKAISRLLSVIIDGFNSLIAVLRLGIAKVQLFEELHRTPEHHGDRQEARLEDVLGDAYRRSEETNTGRKGKKKVDVDLD